MVQAVAGLRQAFSAQHCARAGKLSGGGPRAGATAGCTPKPPTPRPAIHGQGSQLASSALRLRKCNHSTAAVLQAQAKGRHVAGASDQEVAKLRDGFQQLRRGHQHRYEVAGWGRHAISAAGILVSFSVGRDERMQCALRFWIGSTSGTESM